MTNSSSSCVITPWKGPVQLGLTIVDGENYYIKTACGKKLIDVASGLVVVNIGHKNKAMLQALREDETPYVSPGYSIEGREEISERLLSLAGLAGGGVFWCNTGSDANNILRGASAVYHRFAGNPKKTAMATMTGGFHGAIGDTREMTRDGRTEIDRDPRLSEQFLELPAPREGEEKKTLVAIQNIISKHKEILGSILVPGHGGSGEAAAFGWEGMKWFYKELSDICRQEDILLFWDCVMSGGGRTGGNSQGKGFFASDHYGEGIKVDGRSYAKGLTCGYRPGGAAFLSRSIKEAIGELGWSFGSTYSGQKGALIAAKVSLDELEKNQYGLLCNAREMGTLWSKDLAAGLLKEFPDKVVCCNGTGLLQALVLNKNLDLNSVASALVSEGLLPFVFRHKQTQQIVYMITPPLTIDKEAMVRIATSTAKALHKLGSF